jgi:cytidine deaminase
MNELDILKEALSFSIEKDELEKTASIAYSTSGSYVAGSLTSDTNFLSISSEQNALMLSVLQNDYGVNKIVTLTNNEGLGVSPVVVKYLIDHTVRTHIPISYTVLNTKGEKILETADSATLAPFYTPPAITLTKIKNSKIEKNTAAVVIKNPLQLKAFAIKGIERNFPLYDGASGYGTAVFTKSDKVHFAGQYSKMGKGLGVHSEINALISAISEGDKDIEAIGVVSTKYPDTPCNMCGICRQLIAEISAKLNISPKIYCFARDTEEYKEYIIDQYLPNAWTSKKWKQQ